MSVFLFVRWALATWYLAYAITNTHGPFGIFAWIRAHLPLGGLTTCIICMSPWLALIFRVAGEGVILDALSIAGLALILHGWAQWRYNIPSS
jgi:hypothetical protein